MSEPTIVYAASEAYVSTTAAVCQLDDPAADGAPGACVTGDVGDREIQPSGRCERGLPRAAVPTCANAPAAHISTAKSLVGRSSAREDLADAGLSLPYATTEFGMAETKLTKLSAARRGQRPAKFTRPFEDGSVNGFVLEVGPKWLLVEVLDDAVRPNGFQCFRVADVRGFQFPHPHAAFVEVALSKLDVRRPEKPKIRLPDLESLLRSAGREFPLVTIHQEKVDPGVCRIGHVEAVGDGTLSLREINVDAVWETQPTEYRLRDITRVDFGGAYERALHAVGGPASGVDSRVRSQQ